MAAALRPISSLAVSALLALALADVSACTPYDDILAAVELVTGAFEAANSSALAANGATDIAADAGLGVRGPVLKAAVRRTKSCGAVLPNAEATALAQPRLAAAELFQAEEDAARLTSDGTTARLFASKYGPLIKQIKVYWHVIRRGKAYNQGNLPRSYINRQMVVMNQLYRKANLRFNLVRVDVTTNGGWFNAAQGSRPFSDMKHTLHRGTMRDLNVYSCNPRAPSGGYVGGTTPLPANGILNPKLDGPVIYFDTLPGGTIPGQNRGLTLVHEVGHWLGLMHTFNNGCNKPGDGIGDTAYESTPSFDCNRKNTCPQYVGTDPIHNPMNYSPDGCMTQFSKMQCIRMRQNWYAFRR